MSRYTHTLTGQEAKAVESLPDLCLPDAQTQQAKATGTWDGTAGAVPGGGKKWTPELTAAAFAGSQGFSAIATMNEQVIDGAANAKSMQDRKLGNDRQRLEVIGVRRKVMGRTGVEPAAHGFSVRMGLL